MFPYVSYPPLPVWRSILFVPVHRQKFVLAAHSRGADAIQLDLEDSVPPADKCHARAQLLQAVEHLSAHRVPIIVRVNRALDLCVEDVVAAVRSGVNAICLPKVMGAEHVRLLDELITQREIRAGLNPGGVRIIALVETIQALLQVEDIARACPRLGAIALGSEDLSLDAGFEPTPENLFAPCQRLIYAARAAGIRAYGFPGSIAEYSDKTYFQNQLQIAKTMGFDGAFCIHPKQVSVINSVYKPNPADIEQAQRIVAAYQRSTKEQLGAVEVDGKMVDLPVVERAKQLLDQ